MVRTRTFKSGNSVALRLPKTLGIPAGAEMHVREERGKYIVEPVERGKRKLNVAKFWGIEPGLEPIRPEDRVFEPSPRPWDDPDWPGWPDERS